MKNLIIISAAAMLFLATSQMCGCGCKANAATTQPVIDGGDTTQTKTVTLNVKGMTCESCVSQVESEINKKSGVVSCKVNLEQGTAAVSYNPEKTNEKEITQTINNIEHRGKKQFTASVCENKNGCKKSGGGCCGSKKN
ncbi:MAG: cation transporter [Bacteroidetes bacterium]|nr:cation transporter [Bacteroidota bacterium]